MRRNRLPGFRNSPKLRPGHPPGFFGGMSLFTPHATRRPEPLPVRDIHDTTFSRVEQIASIGIAYGGSRLFVSEFNSSRRLLMELWRLGRKRIRVRAMISVHGALDRSSLRALNCYLEHCYGQISCRTMRSGTTHRHAWYDLQRAVGFRWIR